MIIKEMPNEEQPRSKLIKYGSSVLTTKELLAVIIGQGCKSNDIMSIVNDVFNLIDNVDGLKNITYDELKSIKGIGEAKALQILASVELGYRVANYKKDKIKLLTSKEIFDYFYPILHPEKQEVLIAVYYDIKGNCITYKEISRGTINTTIIDPNIIFKWCYRLSSQHFLLIHNHPTGDATPSIPDIENTKKIIEQSNILNLKLLDHIIIGDSYYSMKLRLKNDRKDCDIF